MKVIIRTSFGNVCLLETTESLSPLLWRTGQVVPLSIKKENSYFTSTTYSYKAKTVYL